MWYHRRRRRRRVNDPTFYHPTRLAIVYLGIYVLRRVAFDFADASILSVAEPSWPRTIRLHLRDRLPSWSKQPP
jgi:hypothetical protein